MGKKILFSPIGGTDPISENNCRDGSMLHICRHYKPDKVILFLSGEMVKKHHEDNRYGYCLKKLEELQNRKFDVEYIERPDLIEVQEFNTFFDIFGDILKNIKKDLNDGDEVLLNVSSGTPAMKSVLIVLNTLADYKCTTIQVSTPIKRMNEHTHKETDYETLWELDEDNDPKSKSRCQVVECPTLSTIKKEEIIKKHIEAYDYSAALAVAKTIKNDAVNKGYYSLIEMAQYREMLDYKKALDIAYKNKAYCFPIDDDRNIKIFEYALNIDVKRKRHEYADFIRSLTPLFVDLFEMVLKHETNIDINKYCTYEKKNGKKARVWDLEKLEGTEILEDLNYHYEKGFGAGFIYSEPLVYLIQDFVSSDKKEISDLVGNLREVEKNIRNVTAHEMVCVTDDVIKNKTDFTSNAIMTMIKKVFDHSGIDIKDDDWNSYDLMNKLIIEKIA